MIDCSPIKTRNKGIEMNAWRSFDHVEPRIGSKVEVIAYAPGDGVQKWRGRYVSRSYEQFVLERTLAGASNFFWRHVDMAGNDKRGN